MPPKSLSLIQFQKKFGTEEPVWTKGIPAWCRPKVKWLSPEYCPHPLGKGQGEEILPES